MAGQVQVHNPHLAELKVDHFYHFMMDSESTNLQEKFGDTKFVIMGGSESRMSKFAAALYERLKGKQNILILNSPIYPPGTNVTDTIYAIMLMSLTTRINHVHVK